MIALIPARSQSIRIPDKNISLLGGKPLIYWTIKSALESKVFNRVIVSTDSEKYAEISKSYGAEVIMRPPEYSGEISTDIQWVKQVLSQVECWIFSILRPTSPFRTAETIKRARQEFIYGDYCDSLRAIELCKQHPYKMWQYDRPYIRPLIESGLHSVPYQALPEIYVQNASLEMAWAYVVKQGSISGKIIRPFFTQGFEGFDVNEIFDLKYAEWLIETQQVVMPEY